MARVLVQVVALLAIVASVLGDVAWVKKNEEFMKENANAAGIISLPSGLQYKVLKAGLSDGPKPGPSDKCEVHYRGKLIDGETVAACCLRLP